jgi:hypothetical protein
MSPGIKSANSDITIIFTADSTISVVEDGQISRSSKFTIVSRNGTDNQSYVIETILRPDNLYTRGLIEFCKDEVAFRSSYWDGGDYYFKRITSHKNN